MKTLSKDLHRKVLPQLAGPIFRNLPRALTKRSRRVQSRQTHNNAPCFFWQLQKHNASINHCTTHLIPGTASISIRGIFSLFKLLFQDSTIQVFSWGYLSCRSHGQGGKTFLSFFIPSSYLSNCKEFFLLFSFAGKVKTHERQGCSSILTFWFQNLAIFYDNFWKIFHENNFNSTSCKLRWSLLKINHFLVTWWDSCKPSNNCHLLKKN